MTSTVVNSLGLLRAGEQPFDLTYQFLDAAGAPLDLTGFTASTQITRPDESTEAPIATVSDAAAGVVSRRWVATLTDTPGRYSELISVTDGTYTLTGDLIIWHVATFNP